MRRVSFFNFYSLCSVLVFSAGFLIFTSIASPKAEIVMASNQSGNTPILGSQADSVESQGNNELAVSANVPRAFSFSLSNNSKSDSSKKLMIISSNAKNGWGAWAKPLSDGRGAGRSYSVGLAPSQPTGYPISGTGKVAIVRPVLSFSNQTKEQDSLFQKIAISDGSNNGAAVTVGAADGSANAPPTPLVLVGASLF